MTTAQKVIKCLAIAFAIFLIVTIVSGIMTAGYAIITSTGLVESSKNAKLEDLTIISENTNDVSSLKMEIVGSDVRFVKGEKFEVKTDNANVKLSNENGSIVIKEDRPNLWFFGNSYDGSIIVCLPEDSKQMKEVSIKVAAGNISVQELSTQELLLDLGAGEITINNLIVSNKAKINGGAGQININSGAIKNADIDLGVGEANIKADVRGNSKIDTGIGGLNLNLPLKEQEYKMKIDKGLGEIKLNGKSISGDTIIGQGENYIDIDGGIGEINITTIK